MRINSNSANWRYVGEIIRSRMIDLALTKNDLRRGANFPNQTIVTNLIEGRARLELKYVEGVAKVLQIDTDDLMRLAVCGFLSEDDEGYFKPQTQSDLEITKLQALCEELGKSLEEAARIQSQLMMILQQK